MLLKYSGYKTQLGKNLIEIHCHSEGIKCGNIFLNRTIQKYIFYYLICASWFVSLATMIPQIALYLNYLIHQSYIMKRNYVVC